MDYAKWANKEIDRIAEPRARGNTVESLAARLGMSKNNLYVYLRGEQKFSRKQVDVCAEFFGVESPVRGAARPNNQTNIISLHPQAASSSTKEWVPYPVLGVVEAGAFREADMLTQTEPREVYGERNASYPNATPMAWESHGDSMNEARIFEGTILIGVDFQESGGVLLNDMVVVVEQNRGGLIERSVKAVAVFPDRTEFQPRSTNPIHKAIIYKNGVPMDDAEVRILSVIHSTYNNLLK